MGEDIITLKDISFRYPSGDLALENINLKLPKGKKIALMGENGAGKSTLMLLLNGILKPTGGSLFYKSEKYGYRKSALRELRSKVGVLFQEPDYQLIAPTVYEELSFGLMNKSKDKEWARKKVEQALEDFCLCDLKHKSPHQLSSGQKKNVCLASVLVMEPEVIVCDEPNSSLDSKHSNILFGYLNKLHKSGKTLLISTHDVNHAYSWADYIVLLHKGKIMAMGTPKAIFSQKKMIEQAELSQPFIVEVCNSLVPGIKPEELPSDMNEFYKLVKT